jgi:chromosome segregation ATPase
MEEMQRKIDQAQHEYQDATNGYNQKRKLLQELKSRAEEKAPLNDENGEELPLKAQLEDLPVEDVEEARAALEEARTKVDSIIADPKVVRVYEQKKQELEASETQLDNLTSSRDKRLILMTQNLKPWEEALENFVHKIDAKFSNYMRELGCTGEVGLTKGDPEDDSEYGNFNHWGVEIRVSFRENAKPQVLSARVQSGGERSVSTIMYLMALQEMMVSPFRCVDEINQGKLASFECTFSF